MKCHDGGLHDEVLHGDDEVLHDENEVLHGDHEVRHDEVLRGNGHDPFVSAAQRRGCGVEDDRENPPDNSGSRTMCGLVCCKCGIFG